VRIHTLAAPTNHGHLRLIALALMLMSGWAVAATRFGPEGLVPVAVRKQLSQWAQALRRT
jgi:hypothetical protein